jgi:bifunctional enzyme CysN/CysC
MSASAPKSLLRFLTCGSVDDGKSTLIGRLLYDTQAVPDDQMAALERDSKAVGTQGSNIDFALLVDGLSAEREQGITIDVAYRFFATETRKFIVADTPGHEQYTRNMVTGASTADAAVILADARKGVLVQTRRHSFLCALLGIRKIVLAVNKMDLVGWNPAVFESIAQEYRAFAQSIGLTDVTPIALSGLTGEGVARPSSLSSQTLLAWLEAVETSGLNTTAPFRMPVQWVNRPNPDFRGYAGLIATGAIRTGDRVRILPAGRETRIARIVALPQDLPYAQAGQAVTLTLTDEIDISRGDVIASAGDPPQVADQFEATIVWMDDEPLPPGRSYLLKIGARTATAQVTTIKHRINVNTLEKLAARRLDLNDIAVCNISLDRPVAFEPYEVDRDLGGFILIDRITNRTVGAGMIRFALRRADNIHWQGIDVTREARAQMKGQKGRVVWLTGLSGAGKSTIANLVDKRLHALGRHTYLLDGDNVRHGLNRDLGFTEEDRVENIRRVAEVAKLMADAGLIVITAFISPFRAERRMARELMREGEFIEVFVDAPLDVAEARDVKGLYAKARAGLLKNFTGIDSPYEPPEHAEIVLDTTELSAVHAAEIVVQRLLDPSC